MAHSLSDHTNQRKIFRTVSVSCKCFPQTERINKHVQFNRISHRSRGWATLLQPNHVRLCSQFSRCRHYQMSRLMTKPTKWLCAQRRLGSAWASAQSDQSLHCPGSLATIERTAKTLIRLGGDSGWSVFAGRTCHFVGFVMRRLKCPEPHQMVLVWIWSEY